MNVAVESSSDRAGFFEIEEFAELASYLGPASGAVAVNDVPIIYDRGQAKNRWKGAKLSAATKERKAWINADDLPLVQRDGRLTVGSEELKVAGEPILDETAGVWSVDLVLVS